jgi:hypothetical protein
MSYASFPPLKYIGLPIIRYNNATMHKNIRLRIIFPMMIAVLLPLPWQATYAQAGTASELISAVNAFQGLEQGSKS